MTKLTLKSEVADIIPMCDNLEFVESLNGRMSYKLLKIVKLKHGHTEHGRLTYADMVHHIKRLGRDNDEPLSKRYINILYFKALAKIKELIYEAK